MRRTLRNKEKHIEKEKKLGKKRRKNKINIYILYFTLMKKKKFYCAVII